MNQNRVLEIRGCLYEYPRVWRHESAGRKYREAPVWGFFLPSAWEILTLSRCDILGPSWALLIFKLRASNTIQRCFPLGPSCSRQSTKGVTCVDIGSEPPRWFRYLKINSSELSWTLQQFWRPRNGSSCCKITSGFGLVLEENLEKE